MKRTFTLLAIGCALVLGFILAKYYTGTGDVAMRGRMVAGGLLDGSVKIQPAPVRVDTAFVGELIRRVTSSGTTEAIREVEIKSQITAPVKRVHVDVGTTVSRRDPLIELDDQEYRLILQEAHAKLMNARLEYALLKKEQQATAPDSVDSEALERLREEFETARAAYQAGRITIEEYLEIDRRYQIEKILAGEARDELIEQKSGLTSAEAAYARVDYNLKSCSITAPFNGIVGDMTIQSGDLVTVSQTLMRLVDLSKLRLKLQVMEGDVQYIKKGELVHAHFAAYPDTAFTGRIVGINPIVDQAARTCTVVVEIDNPEGALKSGMYATAQIIVSRYKDRLLVPRDAVVVRDQRKLVFIVRDGKAFWCYIESGIENDEYIEVKSSAFNLKPGERVIVEGHFALAHDAPVSIIGDADPGDEIDRP